MSSFEDLIYREYENSIPKQQKGLNLTLRTHTDQQYQVIILKLCKRNQ